MLAAHDQENRVLGLGPSTKQQGPGTRPFPPKTPAARFPKTPLKVPLHDENAPTGWAGKNKNENAALGGKSAGARGKSHLVTPLEPRTARAPLGHKTTNAKARTGQPGGVKEIVRELETSQAQPTTAAKRPTPAAPRAASSAKRDVHNDVAHPLEEEEDIEYAPPKAPDIPYESDILPEGGLTFEAWKPENRLKGYYNVYFNQVDDDGRTATERRLEAHLQRDLRRLDEQVRRDMDEWDWSIGDVPETKTLRKAAETSTAGTQNKAPRPAGKGPARTTSSRYPPTIASRKAASALSMPPKTAATTGPTTKSSQSSSTAAATRGPSALLPLRTRSQRPALTRESSTERAAAVAASRSTLGYSKGRSTSTAIQKPAPATQGTTRTFARTASTASSGSDTTITPSRFARKQAAKAEQEATRRLEFLSIFEGEGDDDDDFLLGEPQWPYDDGLDDEVKLEIL
ncbi:hypothetical protein VTK73DRAFT_8479 [Phialemonium thermophilum]|uniref:Uncharacterized protein n=1 Tax=Phialemonium thermophilum TaxID=223376 RepID=A0ABR3W8E7_9PEZI